MQRADVSRRQFLSGVSSGLALAALTPAVRPDESQTRTKMPARLIIDSERRHTKIDRRLFGSFLEHMGRAVYDGIFDPESPFADEDGIRSDVLEEIRDLEVPIIRYPGGNFVSGYNWLDGVGPLEERPRVLERAWNSLETNQFGTNEFMRWCRKVRTEPLMAVNLGTGTPETATALLEYCNLDSRTKWADLRREHGYEKPYGVKSWCLGNEMDGPWQIGHMTAREYGMKAADAARQMRRTDRSIQLIACGSSNTTIPTYLKWDQEMLEECYHEVDAISLHRYFNNTDDTGGDSQQYLAMNLSMEKQIREVASVADYVRGRLRSRKKLWLSFDEWNVWYRAREFDGGQKVAPHLLEEVYNLEDALLVGGAINTLIRSADRVKVGCLAQIVNVIAPIMTHDEGLWRQTIYYPYAWALKYARGQVMDLGLRVETFDGADLGPVGYLDVASTIDETRSRLCLFILNRDLEHDRQLELVWRDLEPQAITTSLTLTGADLKATNTREDPDNVSPHVLDPPSPGTKMTIDLPAQSYSILEMKI
ncbi:MAG: alpha-N-arabinofuranosidase [Pirellulaceae bacterium]|nr:alpha-N-arabinofuranosidase [Pirellulaceae bacterium]